MVFCLSVQYLGAQCYPDRHSTNFFDGWISCEPAASPNPDRPVSHFILYDFNKVYALGKMKIWNTNDPSRTTWGMRDVVIDYSLDGQSWQSAGEFTFQEASGLSTYEGSDGPDLGGIEARYLLITAINNYGGDCYGLSEMHVEGEEVEITKNEEVAELECVGVNFYPNPFVSNVVLELASTCQGPLRYIIFDETGKIIDNKVLDLVPGQQQTHTIGAELVPGSYRIRIDFEGKSIQRNLIKISRP